MSPSPLLLFDGVCNLCHSGVRWILARDKRGRIEFASLQSKVARERLQAQWPDGTVPDSIVLITEGKLLIRSDAAIGVGRLLGFPWSLGVVFLIVPRFLRDGVYSWIARNRYRWFGKRDVCSLPAPELMERFLDADEDLQAGASSDSPGSQD
jgi:predicted DCC family thiol-disulfide oxidoreductase YuxK